MVSNPPKSRAEQAESKANLRISLVLVSSGAEYEAEGPEEFAADSAAILSCAFPFSFALNAGTAAAP